jgi:hypothetical protein
MQQQENWCLFRISSHLHVAIRHANPSVMHRLPQAQLSFVLIPQFAGKFSLKTKALFRGNDGVQRFSKHPNYLHLLLTRPEQSADKLGVACSWFIFLSTEI